MDFKLPPLLLCAFFLTGCASSYMSPVTDPAAPATENATITFFRNSLFGSAIQAPVAHEKTQTSGEPAVDPVGVISTGYKVRQEIPAGEHAYVVGGESSSLVRGTFTAGKHYYVRIDPRMGFWKARFAFEPISAEELKNENLRRTIAETKLMELNADGKAWFREHNDSMVEKLLDAIKDDKEDGADGAAVRIKAEDGIDELL